MHLVGGGAGGAGAFGGLRRGFHRLAHAGRHCFAGALLRADGLVDVVNAAAHAGQALAHADNRLGGGVGAAQAVFHPRLADVHIVAGLVGFAADALQGLLDFQRGFLRALGQPAHLVRHHGKAAPGFACARRFDGGVQRQQIGLCGDFLNGGDNLIHLGRLLAQLANVGAGGAHPLGNLAHGGRHIADHARALGAFVFAGAGQLHGVAKLRGQRVGLRHHLLQGLGGVVDGLILPRHNRLGLAGLGLQGVARALGGAGMLADLAQHPAQAAQHRIQPAPQLGQLRTARQAGAHGQVALTLQLAHGRPQRAQLVIQPADGQQAKAQRQPQRARNRQHRQPPGQLLAIRCRLRQRLRGRVLGGLNGFAALFDRLIKALFLRAQQLLQPGHIGRAHRRLGRLQIRLGKRPNHGQKLLHRRRQLGRHRQLAQRRLTVAHGLHVFVDYLGFFLLARRRALAQRQGNMQPRIKHLVIDGGDLLGHRPVRLQLVKMAMIQPRPIQPRRPGQAHQHTQHRRKRHQRGAQLRKHPHEKAPRKTPAPPAHIGHPRQHGRGYAIVPQGA